MALLETLGFFLVKAGGALIDNIAILFVIGVGVGMSDKNDGTGGLAALASWLMMTTLLSTGVVTTIMPSMAEKESAMLAFGKIANPFIGILAGVIGSTCYNKFKSTKLPDWLAFFSGKRCVAIIAGVISIVVSAVLLFVWPLIFGGLVALGEGIVGLDAVGAGIYAFLNRLLIPVGLHHALNNVFWFDTIGLGDLSHFWAGETSADVSWSLGMYMSGFFPCMMFGVPGAALAMIQTAKSTKKKVAIGLVGSAALCAFICGVTEPFEFAFMFLAPGLYVVYALLYGIFTVITVLVGFRAGFSFSAGATDLLFSASLPAAANTWMIIPLGIAAFVVFYLVFRFAIVKFDLKTPVVRMMIQKLKSRLFWQITTTPRLVRSCWKVSAARITLSAWITALPDFVSKSRITPRLTRRRSNLQALQALSAPTRTMFRLSSEPRFSL